MSSEGVADEPLEDDLATQVRRLTEESAEVRQRMTELEATVEARDQRIQELEQENEDLRELLVEEQKTRSQKDAALSTQLKEIEEAVDECIDGDNLAEERDARARGDAKLRRRLTAIADEAGVDVTDSDLLGDDKIRRVIVHGVADIESNPSAVHERARDLIENLPTWGRVTNDALGRRATISAAEARRQLESYRDESLQSSQVRRVFAVVDEWAADSPRDVSVDKRENTRYLAVVLGGVDDD